MSQFVVPQNGVIYNQPYQGGFAAPSTNNFYPQVQAQPGYAGYQPVPSTLNRGFGNVAASVPQATYNPRPPIPALDVRGEKRIIGMNIFKIREGASRRDLEIFTMKLRDFIQTEFDALTMNIHLKEKTLELFLEYANEDAFFRKSAEYDLPYGSELFTDAFKRLIDLEGSNIVVYGHLSRDDPRITEKFKKILANAVIITPECGFIRQ